MKIYPYVLTLFIKPQIWLFHVANLQTTAKKWTKVKNALAGLAKLLFLPAKYANLGRFRCRCRCLSSLIKTFSTEVSGIYRKPQTANRSNRLLLEVCLILNFS